MPSHFPSLHDSDNEDNENTGKRTSPLKSPYFGPNSPSTNTTKTKQSPNRVTKRTQSKVSKSNHSSPERPSNSSEKFRTSMRRCTPRAVPKIDMPINPFGDDGPPTTRSSLVVGQRYNSETVSAMPINSPTTRAPIAAPRPLNLETLPTIPINSYTASATDTDIYANYHARLSRPISKEATGIMNSGGKSSAAFHRLCDTRGLRPFFTHEEVAGQRFNATVELLKDFFVDGVPSAEVVATYQENKAWPSKKAAKEALCARLLQMGEEVGAELRGRGVGGGGATDQNAHGEQHASTTTTTNNNLTFEQLFTPSHPEYVGPPTTSRAVPAAGTAAKADASINYIAILNDYCQRKRLPLPVYEDITLPTLPPRFVYEVTMEDADGKVEVFRASEDCGAGAASKKAAKRDVARDIVLTLVERGEVTMPRGVA